jgi:uncharacterized membrane protein (UPF0182 family)
VIIIVVAVLLVLALVAVRLLAGFYVNYLWYHSVGRTDVFWGMLRAKVTLFVSFAFAFIALAIVNLAIADRLAPSAFSANLHPVVERFHQVFGQRMRMARFGLAILFGLLFALPAVGKWQQWLMFRNSRAFGIDDAQFHHDVGFYLFQLPFIAFTLDWLFAAVLFIIVLVLATHVLNGGIVFQPPRPKVRNATKAHLAVLLALLALLKAGDYWVTRFELTNERRGFVQGATYSVIEAQLPAVVFLVFVAVLTAMLFLSTLRWRSWRVPLVASGLWAVVALLGGVIYPAAVQALVVNPNQKSREAKYIERNIVATRQALGIDGVTTQNVTLGELDADDITDDTIGLQDVRILNPDQMVSRFKSDEGQRAGLVINDLDPDRYMLDGRLQQMIVGARELDLGSVPNKSWQGKHLIYTHGCGVVMAPASQVETNGQPNYQPVNVSRPELYFSDRISGYSIVKTDVAEDPCGTDRVAYSGNGGVALDSAIKRVAFALNFVDYNLFGSGAVNGDSRILWVRDVRDRVRKIAPFLSYDGDPYPVVLGDRVLWVVDGYTTSNRYPYAQNGDRSGLGPGTGLDHDFNYIRNSVKAVVDAYDGSVSFYAVDAKDPVLLSWSGAFPHLFKPMDQMPPGLAEHLRYPEDLFRVQTTMYSKYLLDPAAFFDRRGAWSVDQAPQVTLSAATGTTVSAAPPTTEARSSAADALATDSNTERFEPYYTMFRPPRSDTSSFDLLRPFVQFSPDDQRKQLQAYMTASSDPATYGQLTAYVIQEPLPDGPSKVAITIASDPTISSQLTLLNQQGSSVSFGDLQIVPVDGSLLYVRPMYTRSSESAQVRVQNMIVSYNGRAAMDTTLGGAIAKLFPGFDVDLHDRVPSAGQETPSTTAPAGGTTPTTDTPTELLQRADDLFHEADEALQAGNLGEYQAKEQQARALVQQALSALTPPAG